MLVAVEETATATGKETGQTTACDRGKAVGHAALFTLRQIAFAALALPGVLPSWPGAQIVPGGAHAPGVITTQNGLPQVNISRPSGAGVSMNTYGQFDVQKNGVILNNSPTIVQSQQAGMINGAPNFGPDQSARVIVNQVTLNYIDDLAIGSRYTVRGFDGETMLAAEKGFYWRNELQWPVFQTGQTLYAGIDYGRVFGPNTVFLAGTQLAGAVIGIRGRLHSRFVGFSYDMFTGTSIYKPPRFPASRVTVGLQMTAQF